MTELAKHLRSDSSNETDGLPDPDIEHFFPHFIYVLRDFHADMERDGRQLTADEYLEECLVLKVSKLYHHVPIICCTKWNGNEYQN